VVLCVAMRVAVCVAVCVVVCAAVCVAVVRSDVLHRYVATHRLCVMQCMLRVAVCVAIERSDAVINVLCRSADFSSDNACCPKSSSLHLDLSTTEYTHRSSVMEDLSRVSEGTERRAIGAPNEAISCMIVAARGRLCGRCGSVHWSV